MIQGYKVLAIIPARGGSKGIPKKNLSMLKDKTLLEWAIDVAKVADPIDDIVVSTDDAEIEELARKCGAEVLGKRPESLSNDSAKTVDVIRYEIKRFQERKGWGPDIVILLQPTQPFRTKNDLVGALDAFLDSGGDGGLVSLSEVDTHPLLIRKFVDGKSIPILNMSSTVRRQDFPKFWKVNGAVYINWARDYQTEGLSLNDNLHGYITSEWTKIDIDTQDDLEYANLISARFLAKIK